MSISSFGLETDLRFGLNRVSFRLETDSSSVFASC